MEGTSVRIDARMVEGMVITPMKCNPTLEGNLARMSWLIEHYVVRRIWSSVMPNPFNGLPCLDHDLGRLEAYVVDDYFCTNRPIE
jgi:hypothetical protein